MSTFTDIAALIDLAPSYKGYPPTGARAPYVVTRPLLYGEALDRALSGDSLGWDVQYAAYCAGESVEACFNLTLGVMQRLDGARVAGTTLATSIGYIGLQVEGHYETMLTIQLNQGGIS